MSGSAALPGREPPAPATYHVVDRELLLPAYKRFLVEPLLPLIPGSVHPNSLTHLGHLACLGAAALLVVSRASGGWPLVAATLLLNVYVWLDNADGGHARRTARASLGGEVLDHGLDVLNAAYMGLLAALTVGADAGWTVCLVAASSASMAISLWEQAHTGVLQLGRLQQLEFAGVLSLVMLASARWGTGVWREVALGPLPLQAVLLSCLLVAVAFGMAQSALRVRARGRAWPPLAGYLALAAACVSLSGRRALPAMAAVLLVTVAAAAFGARMLLCRVRGERPRVGVSFGAWAALLLLVHGLGPSLPVTWAALGAGLFYAASAVRAAAALRAAVGERS